MEPQPIGFFARFALALRILFDGLLAARTQQALDNPLPAPEEPKQLDAPQPEPAGLVEVEAEAMPEPEAEAAAPETSTGPQPSEPTAALQLLSLLQREGRLIDFLREDVTGFSDDEVGAAARVVHEGCQKVLSNYFELSPVREEEEGDAVVLESGFDAKRHRLTGNVSGTPPYRGSLAHAGWEVKATHLPTLNADHDPNVVAPAEVEL